MEVLKQISPMDVPVAPKDSPSKCRPSSRAISVRTSPRSMNGAHEFSNSSARYADTRLYCHVEPGEHLWLFTPAPRQKRSEMESLASPRKSSGLRCSFASLRMIKVLTKKPGSN